MATATTAITPTSTAACATSNQGIVMECHRVFRNLLRECRQLNSEWAQLHSQSESILLNTMNNLQVDTSVKNIVGETFNPNFIELDKSRKALQILQQRFEALINQFVDLQLRNRQYESRQSYLSAADLLTPLNPAASPTSGSILDCHTIVVSYVKMYEDEYLVKESVLETFLLVINSLFETSTTTVSTQMLHNVELAWIMWQSQPCLRDHDFTLISEWIKDDQSTSCSALSTPKKPKSNTNMTITKRQQTPASNSNSKGRTAKKKKKGPNL